MTVENTVAVVPSKFDTLPISEQMAILREEVRAIAISVKEWPEEHRQTMGRFCQQFNSTFFYYDQWSKNRDYSSVINASMALGKLMIVVELTLDITGERADEVKVLRDKVNVVGSHCWEEIRGATGRIVPFE